MKSNLGRKPSSNALLGDKRSPPVTAKLRRKSNAGNHTDNAAAYSNFDYDHGRQVPPSQPQILPVGARTCCFNFNNSNNSRASQRFAILRLVQQSLTLYRSAPAPTHRQRTCLHHSNLSVRRAVPAQVASHGEPHQLRRADKSWSSLAQCCSK